MIVLWLLILRGIAIEFRNHIDNQVWQPMWDTVFGGSSALLAIFFGAALGNVIRGVPLDREGYFFLPLWTNFVPGQNAGILDWYTLLIAVSAFLVLAAHGALWVALKTEGDLERRARHFAQRLWWFVLPAVIIITLASFRIQPNIARSFHAHPWGYAFPLLALIGLVGIKFLPNRDAFLASCLFILGMLTSAAFGLYPYLLPSNGDHSLGLTVYNTAASPYGLTVGLVWFIPGVLLALGYFAYTYRSFAGKIRPEDDGY